MNLERKSCKTVFLGSHYFSFELTECFCRQHRVASKPHRDLKYLASVAFFESSSQNGARRAWAANSGHFFGLPWGHFEPGMIWREFK